MIYRKLITRADFEITRLKLLKFCQYSRPPSTELAPSHHYKNITRLTEQYRITDREKIIVLTDDFRKSPGGYSALSSLASSLSLIGCKVLLCTRLDEREIEQFKPTSLLASDTPRQLVEIKKNKTSLLNQGCKVGLSLVTYADEPHISEDQKFSLYKDNGVKFLWGFKTEDYYERSQYVARLRSELDIKVISLPFGADIFNYYPIIKTRNSCKLDFIFFASRNLDKWNVLKPLLLGLRANGLKGLINGPGWNLTKNNILKHEHMQFLCSSRNGLNVHIPMSRTAQTELNERFYNLLLSGIPQVVDDLPILAPLGFIDRVKVYKNLEQLISYLQPDKGCDRDDVDRAIDAYEFVMKNHTNVHRAHHLHTQLRSINRD